MKQQALRRAKIVATIGPASQAPEQLQALIEAGMDVARLNFSHGSHADHTAVIGHIRRIGRALGRPVAILQDLQGPKIRLGELVGGTVELAVGAAFCLTTEEVEGDGQRAWVSYAALARDVQAGDEILLSDGLLRLRVEKVEAPQVYCRVVDGGRLRPRAGINLPGVALSVPALTDKDRDDLQFGMDQGVDFVALSFVRAAADIVHLKEIMATAGADIPVVAKIEKPEALAALDEILQAADGVMVARGDLGVEVSPERVPFVQKRIIQRAFRYKIPVITATQMLESMIEQPRPTRAEASDVANAVFDGTDAVMLSGETAIGVNPVGVVQMMDRIVRAAESDMTYHRGRPENDHQETPASFPDAVAEAACSVAVDIGARAIIAFTQSGFTARLISKYRPPVPIISITSSALLEPRLCLFWGVAPKCIELVDQVDELIGRVEAQLLDAGAVATGDALVILAGSPMGQTGTTNLMKLHRVGEK
ncbi:MAG: pyruvate kinase [Candidatus Latescibacteria bacterium]|nr:pyruvate kinase [Candidatus Latescibacterota bacterium]